jgi:hypothetical protein
MDDRHEADKLRQSLRHNRTLLAWVTDDRAREALMEMIAEDEARLNEIEHAEYQAQNTEGLLPRISKTLWQR